MPGNDQIAPGIVSHLQPAGRWPDQTDADESDPCLGARDAGEGVFPLAQSFCMITDQAGQPGAEK